MPVLVFLLVEGFRESPLDRDGEELLPVFFVKHIQEDGFFGESSHSRHFAVDCVNIV